MAKVDNERLETENRNLPNTVMENSESKIDERLQMRCLTSRSRRLSHNQLMMRTSQ